ncbi:DUF2958 domain-containing protein [Rhizobium metallidurans]|uniref:Uncharacterized protein n=1 Tax=Rhizobium metallidurans TaxID=1265931 RepID=A0A7W6GDM0_9HYPH|nr:DUF2958 domain-containing protein [Rhizobium metallidurans]MBB3967332.1 hypothetical protein [Rhizobium metallidurans]
MAGGRPRYWSDNDNRDWIKQAQIDLVLLFSSELHVGKLPFYKQKAAGKALDLVYEFDGLIHRRHYLSPLSWRAIILFAVIASKTLIVHDIDRRNRYRQLFPRTLVRRLNWHARPDANFPPVVRLFDPRGDAVMLLTRSRLCGHAVDALHNLGEKPVFQTLLISDIMALRPMLGIELVRDETFSSATPIKNYVQAAGLTGRITDEPELPRLVLAPINTDLVSAAPPTATIARIFDQQCRKHPSLQRFRQRRIFDDYCE